jgi:hypothetical protein
MSGVERLLSGIHIEWLDMADSTRPRRRDQMSEVSLVLKFVSFSFPSRSPQ